ncbi:MAG: hypothetical protein WBG82_02230 [Parvibaculum sp.]|uniref:hypothetical protein n=1 Tax=Parvibaculum sp. TaxID=2024848 RepID=UPI003C778F70
MTIFAVLPPRLTRLFSRIDAADASSERLHLLLDFWAARRNARILPMAADLGPPPPPHAAHAFLFRRLPGPGRDWEAAQLGADAADLIGLTARGRTLSDLAEPRIAVRLRRLFEFVARTGEPVAAMFEARSGTRRKWIEVLAAPLSSNAIDVDGIFGGIAARREATRPRQGR